MRSVPATSADASVSSSPDECDDHEQRERGHTDENQFVLIDFEDLGHAERIPGLDRRLQSEFECAAQSAWHSRMRCCPSSVGEYTDTFSRGEKDFQASRGSGFLR